MKHIIQNHYLKILVAIILWGLNPPKLHGQEFLDYKNNAPLSMDLYWAQGFHYLENERYSETRDLLKTLAILELSSCASLITDFGDLEQTLLEEDKSNALRAFTQFVLHGILLDMNQMSNVDDPEIRGKAIQTLFKELISIQKYAKRFEFQTYRELVISFRRLNQLSKEKVQLDRYLMQNQLVQETIRGC